MPVTVSNWVPLCSEIGLKETKYEKKWAYCACWNAYRFRFELNPSLPFFNLVRCEGTASLLEKVTSKFIRSLCVGVCVFVCSFWNFAFRISSWPLHHILSTWTAEGCWPRVSVGMLLKVGAGRETPVYSLNCIRFDSLHWHLLVYNVRAGRNTEVKWVKCSKAACCKDLDDCGWSWDTVVHQTVSSQGTQYLRYGHMPAGSTCKQANKEVVRLHSFQLSVVENRYVIVFDGLPVYNQVNFALEYRN